MKRILFYAPGPTYFRHAMSISRATGVPPIATSIIDELKAGQVLTGNKGNAVHAEAPAKLFRKSDAGSAMVSLPHLYRDLGDIEYKKKIARFFDAVVVSFANFIRPRQNHESIFQALKALPDSVPLIVLGAGIQDKVLPRELTQSTIDLFELLGQKAVLFGVRGVETQNWLNDQGVQNTKALGCPSMYVYPLSIANTTFSKIPERPTIITAGHLSRTKLTVDQTPRGRLFAEVFSGVSFADYVFQDEPFSFGDLTKKVGMYNEGTGEMLAGPINAYLSELSGRQIKFGKYYYFLDVSAWRQMCMRYDVYIGDRFHAGVAAMQASVPSLILKYDERVSELTSHFQMPTVSLSELKQSSIQEVIREKLTTESLEKLKNTYKFRLAEFCGEMEKLNIDVISKQALQII